MLRAYCNSLRRVFFKNEFYRWFVICFFFNRFMHNSLVWSIRWDVGSIPSLLFFCRKTHYVWAWAVIKISSFLCSRFVRWVDWAQRSWIWAVAVPLLCMIMFSIHPVGNQAMLYTLYWLIPIILFFIPKQILFTHALTATFIAHAVGSVLWLYSKPATPAFWFALIPVVACERFLFAVGMTVVHRVIAMMGHRKQRGYSYRLLRV